MKVGTSSHLSLCTVLVLLTQAWLPVISIVWTVEKMSKVTTTFMTSWKKPTEPWSTKSRLAIYEDVWHCGRVRQGKKSSSKKKIKLMQEVVQHWDDGTDENWWVSLKNGAVWLIWSLGCRKPSGTMSLEFASYAFNKSHSAGCAIFSLCRPHGLKRIIHMSLWQQFYLVHGQDR